MDREDRIFEEFSKRMREYNPQPDEKLWDNIEKQINKPKISFVKTAVVTGVVILVGVVAAVIFAPKTINKENNVPTLQISRINTEEKITTPQQTVQKLDLIVSTTDAAEKVIEITEQTIPNNTVTPNVTEVKTEVNVQNTNNNPAVELKQTTNTQLQTSAQKNNDVNDEKIDVKPQNDVKSSEENPQNPPITMDELQVPNAFQPSSPSERVNTFKPAYKEVRNYEMNIYSRYGREIFSTKDITIGWDGTVKGQLAPTGVYVYYLKYEDMDGKLHEKGGKLLLQR